MTKNHQISFTTCKECHGLGKKRQRLRKKVRIQYQKELDQFEESNKKGLSPVKPKGHYTKCLDCDASGIVPAENHPNPDNKNYPHVAIIGGGIGGVALAVACLHRGIPFTLYERDTNFDARSQGYGLTLQQASKAIKGFGILALKEGVISTLHLVHNTNGKIIGEWGARKWLNAEVTETTKRFNVHIARQSLRLALLEQLKVNSLTAQNSGIKWGHQLISIEKNKDEEVSLSFKVNNEIKHTKADLVVGADGIRSTVRKLLIGEDVNPLQYLGCIVILGICPLTSLKNKDNPLLDLETVFQTVNGNERIYMMPYSADTIMWQLSFPMPEKEAKELSAKGTKALKKEACKRTQWHDPVPQIMEATSESQITGYPVYDRALLDPELLAKQEKITLIGDAAHPMSPFKGQGANQALLDALSLAREISIGCKPLSNWKKEGIRKTVLNTFESEMLTRTAAKVKGSAEAVKLLHSKAVLHDGDKPRGRGLKKKL